MNIDWNKAYAKLFSLLDNKNEKTYFSGPEFLNILREYNYGIPSYHIYINELKNQDKSTSRKDYYRDEFFKLNENHRKSVCLELGDLFLEKNPESPLVKDYIEFFKGNKKIIATNSKLKQLKEERIESKTELVNDSQKKTTEDSKSPKVFVTYSWDSPEHQEWVRVLVNTLRTKDGIDAMIDEHIMQRETVNLNKMMVDNIYKSDFVVIVLTENYARKANEGLGGVGFESTYLMDILNNPNEKDKIILLNRYNSDSKSAIPNFLNGYSYIDVSGEELEIGYNKLIHKIHKIDMNEIPKLEKKRKLQPRKAKSFDF